MASLSEMVQAADYLQRGKLAADPLYSGVASFGQGVEKGFETGNKGLETAIKLIELKGKLAELKQKAETQKMLRDVLKAEGYLPLDEDEKAAARGAANNAIGTADIDPADSIKTTQGKVASLVNSAAVDKGSKYKVDPVASVNSGKIKIKEKASEKALKDTERLRIRALAKDMAKGAFAEKVTKDAGGRPSFFDTDRIKGYIPPQTEIDKFMPTAEAYLRGTAPAVREPSPEETKKAQAALPSGPDTIGDLEDIDSLWALIKQ